jgi:hypothetical protein
MDQLDHLLILFYSQANNVKNLLMNRQCKFDWEVEKYPIKIISDKVLWSSFLNVEFNSSLHYRKFQSIFESFLSRLFK